MKRPLVVIAVFIVAVVAGGARAASTVDGFGPSVSEFHHDPPVHVHTGESGAVAGVAEAGVTGWETGGVTNDGLVQPGGAPSAVAEPAGVGGGTGLGAGRGAGATTATPDIPFPDDTAGPPVVDWSQYDQVSFNDMAWTDGQPTTNITRYTSPNGSHSLPSSGSLLDADDGTQTEVALSVSGGSYDAGHATVYTAGPAPGTEAHQVFGEDMDASGSVSYANSAGTAGDLVLTLTGLDPARRYTVVSYGHRNEYGWDRAALVSLTGADAFVNASSAAVDDEGKAMSHGPGDSSTRVPSDNDAGLITRFTDVLAGGDGAIELRVSWDGASSQAYRGKYLNALMVARQPQASATPAVDRVVLVSIDGLRTDVLSTLAAESVSNLTRITRASATLNARTNFDPTVTLPNHISMLTGRPALGTDGHGYLSNSDPAPGVTLHSNKGEYLASAFDVAHDSGLGTALFASKSKFSLFDSSYDAQNGAPDVTGADDGIDKIDAYTYDSDADRLADSLITYLESEEGASGFVMFHDRRPDSTGHAYGWSNDPGSAYAATIADVDATLGRILDAIAADVSSAGTTALILTADHGGSGSGHYDTSDPATYTIPFAVWRCDSQPKADLYSLNPGRVDPGTTSPPDPPSAGQPIRNGGAANVALDLLGLGPVDGSLIGAGQDLVLFALGEVPLCSG